MMALYFPNILKDVEQPVSEGIQGLERFVEVLQANTARSRVTTLAKVEKVAKTLRPLVDYAFERFSRANNVASAANARISQEIEASVAKQHQLSCAIRQLEGEEADLLNRVGALNNNVEDAMKQVQDERNVLFSAESILKDAQKELNERRQERDIVGAVGCGITAIPVFGWIAGPVMVTVSLTALKDAVKAADSAVNSARDNVRGRENSLERKKRELEALQKELERKKGERENKVCVRGQRQKELELKKETQKQLLDVGQKLKYLVTAVSTTQGRTKVLRDQLEYIYSLETLLQPLQAIASHFQSDAVNKSRLLTGELSLVSSIQKFRTICDSADHVDEDLPKCLPVRRRFHVACPIL